MARMRNTNADLLAARLKAHGVRHAFGIPSGQVLTAIEAFEQHGIRFVLVSHEMTAAFMAQAVGRLTGVPGLAVATLGPGATNLATGVGGALLDRSPCLVLTGQVPSSQIGRRVQMHIDHQALFRPLTKASFLLEPGAVVEAVDRGVAVATTEPPGPVHLEFPEDFAAAPAQERPARLRRALKDSVGGVIGLEEALAVLRRARRPVAALGLTAARSGQGGRIRRLLERRRIPFVTTMMGKGVIPDDHPLSIGVVGRARHRWIEEFLADADLILGIGYDPVEIGYEDWMPDVPLVHVDREAADVDPRVKVAAELRGDLAIILPQLLAADLPEADWDSGAIRAFRARLHRGLRPASRRLQPHQILDLLRQWLPADGILTCDVGAHTHLVATQWPVLQPGTLLVSNGWSSMGSALPAALAAKLTCPEREVACIMGDGGFLMLAGEMATAARLGLKVLFIVLRDGTLSLIEAKQRKRGYRVVGVDLFRRRCAPPAHYFGVPCVAAGSVEDFRKALARARRQSGPMLIEAEVDGSHYERLLYH